MVTKNRGPVLQLIVLASWGLLGLSCGGRSRLLELNVNVRSLRENTVGLSSRQPVLVYLPPSYGQSGQRRYPVLYFLPGYDDPAWIFTGGALQGFRLRDAMDRLASEGRIGEMIAVLPSGATPLGGTFYTNSSVLGHWEDYISRELVEYVDSSFRTQRSPARRAIAGTTAGGSGALILAMHHPDVFGSVYALDPVLLRPGALEEKGLCGPAEARCFLGLQEEWSLLPEQQAGLALTLYLQGRLGSGNESDHLQAFFIAMGAAFSPDPGKRGLPVRFPYGRTAAGLAPDPSARAAFEAGLGGWEEKVIRYGPNLRRLRLLAIDYGTGTGIRWLPEGCVYLSDLMASAGIPHRTLPHDGNQEGQFRQRMEGFLLPMVSEVLHAQESNAIPAALPAGRVE